MVVPVAFDGWLMYVERVSCIENLILMVVTAGFVLYQARLGRGPGGSGSCAGLALGPAGCLKYTGVYVIHRARAVVADPAPAARRARASARYGGSHSGALDQALPDRPVRARLHSPQTATQIKRVLGLQGSGGTLSLADGAACTCCSRSSDIFAVSFLRRRARAADRGM